jgi:hypothetical protein
VVVLPLLLLFEGLQLAFSLNVKVELAGSKYVESMEFH